MARSVILMKAGLLSQKNEGKVTKIGTKYQEVPLAHRAGWSSPLQDAMATVLMNPDKKGCLLPSDSCHSCCKRQERIC